MKTRNNSVFSFKVDDSKFEKSSYSRIITRCVAIAKTAEGVAIRDTKDAKKTTLFFNNDEWNAFLKGAKNGEFD